MVAPTLANFFSLAERLDAPVDQVANFLRARVALTPEQARSSALARTCDRPDGPRAVIHDASVDPPGSIWGFAQAVVDDCVRVRGLRFLYLVRVEDGRSVCDAVADLRRQMLRRMVHQYDEVAGRIELANGSSVVLGGIRTEADVEGYLGVEWDGAVVEGADQVGVESIRALMTCVRSSRADWRGRTYLLVTGEAATPSALEPDEPADPTTALRLIRVTKQLVVICLTNGWSVEQTRTLAWERASRGIPAGDHPALVFLRATLSRAIDQAITETLHPLGQEA